MIRPTNLIYIHINKKKHGKVKKYGFDEYLIKYLNLEFKKKNYFCISILRFSFFFFIMCLFSIKYFF